MTGDPSAEEFLPADARARLERVRAAARAVLRDDYKARDFLVRPHPLLDRRRPMELILGGEEGTRRVERLLERLRTAVPR